MQASRRHHYLSALGIEGWLPRRKLPGAAPGPVYVRKIAQSPDAATQMPASVTEHIASKTDSAAAPSSAAKLQQALTNPAPKQTTIAQAQPVAVTQAAVGAFKLAFYSWAPGVLIVDEAQDARLQQQLISNILFALGHTNLQRQQPDYFQWPMPGGRQAFALAPHDMVFGALQRMLEQHKPAHMLLMGKLSAQHVLGADDDNWVAGNSLDSSPLYSDVSLISTHSSSTLLEQPLLKAETWLHLQAMRV